ncbi:MAG: insulinase family protein [Victivallaceae bacterium]|nr:insulinase family protein [Victivallaceae bacterium]
MKFYCNTIVRRLENGMRVFVLPRPGATAVVQCFVQTGSVNEGRHLGCGLSHFLEHMMFQGCKGYPGTSAADAISALGGVCNAFTGYDQTSYYAMGEGRHVPKLFDVLSSMIRYPEFPEKRFASEREVILRERDMGCDSPDRRLFEALTANIYQVNPMRLPIIGVRDLIAGVDNRMMREYYCERYTPERIFWVFTGDVNADAVCELVRAKLGDWQPSSLYDAPLPVEPPQNVMRRSEFSFNDPLDRLAVGFAAPPIWHEDIPALDVISGVLAMGDGSRLVRKLEQTSGLAADIRSFCYSQPCGGLCCVSAAMTPGKAARLESALLDELEKVRRYGFTAAEVRREKTMQLAEHLRELRGIQDVSGNIGGGVIASGSPAMSDVYLERLEKLTLDEINEVASRYFTPEHYSLVHQTGEAKPKITKSASEKKELKPEFFESSGLRCALVRDTALPLIDFTLVLPGGALFEPPGLSGAGALLAEILPTGTAKRGESAFLTALDGCGASLRVNSGMNSLMVELNAPRRYFGRAFGLVTEMLMTPRFGRAEFEREKCNRVELLKSRELSPRYVAMRRAASLLLGDHPYGNGGGGSASDAERLELSALIEFYTSRWVKSRSSCGFGGDLSMKEAASYAGKLAAAGWCANAIATPPFPEFPVAGRRENVEVAGREQAAAVCAVPGTSLLGEELAALEIMQAAENGLSSPVFKRVREDNALAYSVGMNFTGGFQPGGIFFYAMTSHARVDDAVSLLAGEIEALAADGIAGSVFASARETASFAVARQNEEVGPALAASLLDLYYDRPAGESWRHRELLNSLDREAVNHILRGIIDPVRMMTVTTC